VSEGAAGKPGLWQVVKSVLAAFLGVQSNQNRERDFTHGSAGMFIAVGLGMTLLFVLAVWAVVKLVLPESP
jgi:hypothetical protein